MNGFVDRSQGGVTELRVHGVSATAMDAGPVCTGRAGLCYGRSEQKVRLRRSERVRRSLGPLSLGLSLVFRTSPPKVRSVWQLESKTTS